MIKDASYLQQILGTSGKNKIFSVHQNSDTLHYHVYYGLELFDIIPDNKKDTWFKLMVAHMHIVGFTLKDDLEDPYDKKNSAYLALELARRAEQTTLGKLLIKQKSSKRNWSKRARTLRIKKIKELNVEQQKKVRALKAGQRSARKHVDLRELKIAQSQGERSDDNIKLSALRHWSILLRLSL